MQKQINLTKEEAIKFYNSSTDQGFKDLLETNFGKDFYKQDITDIVYDLNSLIAYCDKKLIPFGLPYNDPDYKIGKTLNAVYILSKVAEVYNEGTVLDWKNNVQYKYLPNKNFDRDFVNVNSSSNWYFQQNTIDSLYYKNSVLSKKSYNNFKQYWENYWGV